LDVAGVVALIAQVTEQQADYLLLSSERQPATRCMPDVRVLQRAVQMLENYTDATCRYRQIACSEVQSWQAL
jgi:hypothetical protein